MKVLVGLSGGVDSSVAALLLQGAGHEVGALFMKNWEEDDASGACPAEADAEDARRVARQLGIPFFGRNFAAEYWDGVFAVFLAELKAGRTPNPDILCNREVKFRTFVEHALDLGYERVATGHYAQLRRREGQIELLRGADPGKDQSYFLHALDQAQLAVAEFPVGHLHKSEVRHIATEARLPTHAKRDSTGICFIGERAFDSFVARYLAPKPGPMRTPEGETIGEHRGLQFHTIGQRGGLGIGGRRGGSGEPWFVAAKSASDNTLWVVQGEHPALYGTRLRSEAIHWIAGTPPAAAFTCSARIRYRQQDQTCRVRVLDGGSADVVFDQRQRAITPGQSVVFYAGEVCLGGGIIAASDAFLGGL
ncbi:MAG: tRNA 2-thiouridine(34) synthase MnmA [Xanthomonadales bacterium]|nr:tRNA-specific 2-thiouridylase MnmA [Xanthomonadales bacterium]MCC6593220.1 tRNA 2-thiouridine(34) synthase MnmA [Xanthomonadales bacterium]MCE7929839.1 tRNA 2-thiouridine(34) synthase MnmA [Xanthomonadales bacterium PRO6]